MWTVVGVVIVAGAIAVLVWCPIVRTLIWRVISSTQIRKIVKKTVGTISGLLTAGAIVAGIYSWKNMDLDKSMFVMVSNVPA